MVVYVIDLKEGSAGSMLLAALEKCRNGPLKEAESFVESTLIPPQGCLEVLEDRPLEGIIGSRLQVSVGGHERCLGCPQIRFYAMGIADIRPGSCPEVFNQLNSVALEIKVIG
jgi:hypothetical protein